MSTTAFNMDILNLQSWHHGSCGQTELEKKGLTKNSMESSNSSRLKFWQIVAMKRALKKKKIHRSRTNKYVIPIRLYKMSG